MCAQTRTQKRNQRRAQKRTQKLQGGKMRRFPDDFPDELLLKIVACFESTLTEEDHGHLEPRFDCEFYANIRTIQDLRLTCRRLCEISSQFLVPYIHLTPSLASLNHFDQVTNHPTISRGLRWIFVNMAILVPKVADDFKIFLHNRNEKLQSILIYGDGEDHEDAYRINDFGREAHDVKRILECIDSMDHTLEDQFGSYQPGTDEPSSDQDSANEDSTDEDDPYEDDVNEHDLDPSAHDMAVAPNPDAPNSDEDNPAEADPYEDYDPYDDDDDPAQYDPSVWMYDDISDESKELVEKILRREHVRYRKLYEEQKNILQSGHWTRTVAAAAARIPSNVSLYIWDQHKDPIHDDRYGVRQALRHHGSRDVDHDFVLRFIGMREGESWGEIDGEDVLREAPMSVFYELPLAMSAAGANLTELVVDIIYLRIISSGLTLNITQEQISALGQVSKKLERFKFNLGGRLEETQSVSNYLSGITGSRMIPDLSLNLGFCHDKWSDTVRPFNPRAIGPLKLSGTWDRLKSLELRQYSLHFNDLENLLSFLKPEMRVILGQIKLVSGTWADALDLIRSKAGPQWEVDCVSGAEADNMPHKRHLWPLLLGTPRLPPNMATHFIRSDGLDKNPLREVDRLSSVLDEIVRRVEASGYRGDFHELLRRAIVG